MQLRFLADMNLSPLTVADLGKDGYDITPQIENPLSAGSAVTVDDTTVRIRKLPIR